MLFLLGENENLRNIYILSQVRSNTHNQMNYNNLRENFTHFLHSIQPHVPHAFDSVPHYVLDSEKTKKLIEVFTSKSLTDDTTYDLYTGYDNEYTKSVLDSIKKSVIDLGNLYKPIELVFNLSINSIFCTPSNIAAGGTTSGAIGVLWADPRKNWSDFDFYEFIIHELCHTLLFIHEWRWGLFSSQTRLANTNTYAMSAIRTALRPMDKAFHSAIVATDILLFREKFIGHEGNRSLHPYTNELIKNTIISIDSIIEVDNREKILTEKARELLSLCVEKINVSV